MGWAVDFVNAGLVALAGVVGSGCCNAAAASMTALADVGVCQSICLVGVIVAAILGKLTIAAGWVANAGRMTWVGVVGTSDDTGTSFSTTTAMLADDAATGITGVALKTLSVAESDDRAGSTGAITTLDCTAALETVGISLVTTDVTSLGAVTTEEGACDVTTEEGACDVTTEDGTVTGATTTDDALCDTGCPGATDDTLDATDDALDDSTTEELCATEFGSVAADESTSSAV